MEVLEDIPFSLDPFKLQERLRIDPDSSDATEFQELFDAALAVARPKAIYMECFVEERGRNAVTIRGVTFTSAALRANLDGVHRTFPFVATCGNEIDRAGLAGGDFFKEYWLDTTKADLLRFSIRYLCDHMDRRYALGKMATMSPGSGDATVWPIEQQRLLFSLFGDVEMLIGVKLTDSFLMIPNKTVSGMRFPTEIGFRSCQLCHRRNCPSRSAPFDQAMWAAVQHGEKPPK
jgi:hypothetical protein